MSSNLMWRPQGSGVNLSSDIKFLLRLKFGNPIECVLSSEDLDYLDGLADGVTATNLRNEIRSLIKAVRAHEYIEVKEHW